jgi:hypothetical protein
MPGHRMPSALMPADLPTDDVPAALTPDEDPTA